jgi:hypothetical protein
MRIRCHRGFVGFTVRLVARLADGVIRVRRESEVLRAQRMARIDFVTIGTMRIAVSDIILILRLLMVFVIGVILVWMIVILHLVLLPDMFVRRRFVVGMPELRRICRCVLMVRILDDGALHAFAVVAPARTAIP